MFFFLKLKSERNQRIAIILHFLTELRVTSSNPRVTSSNPRVRRLKSRVARLKARVRRLKT